MVWRRELGVLAVNWTDIVDGAIANAAWGVVSMVAKPRTARRVAANLDTAAWADTERLIRDALAEIEADPSVAELSAEEAAQLETAVRTPEAQGALQALLAARLTDAQEADAARAREAVRLALTQAVLPPPDPADRRRKSTISAESAQAPLPAFQAAGQNYAATLSDYFDDKISALVGTLEGRVGFKGLAQVRAEAYNARIVALLGAIERQVAALADPSRGTQAEADFLQRYRRQAHQRHGFLTPPDFDRRRRVPVVDIYVPTEISEEDDPERLWLTPDTEPGSLNVWDLEGRLDRTVLLGDPGGGKTTAANVLTDRLSTDRSPRVAFLVTLREYAAKTPIEWSVTEHIEHNLSALYQTPAPQGLVERLLLTGRSVVIFDGLDELLETARRRDVSDRVEQFCSAYPLAPVLVTSRVVGYDQARLDDRQFSCYRLGGFGDDQVAEYAGKWFRSQEGLAPAEAAAKAEAFLGESAHAMDLRANPLLLSLMCILYRGAGSLPGDRAGIYARCAELLLRKWDEQRDLYRKLGSDHLVEPTLRHLAWWLFTREDGQTAATERELIVKAAEFLHERGYETEDQARAAAREFVEFCRGRMWVFSDAGTTADGEKLYGFTHRTFLEYFAAWQLAVTSESPEDLARVLAPRIMSEGWRIVAELAIKVKSDMSDRGADRAYLMLLDPALPLLDQSSLLEFLSVCLPSTRPSPSTVRILARAAFDHATGRGEPVKYGLHPLLSLLDHSGGYAQSVAAELGARIAEMIASSDIAARDAASRLVVSIASDTRQNNSFWRDWGIEQRHIHQNAIVSAADRDGEIRGFALAQDLLTPEAALAMPGGLSSLATVEPVLWENQEKGSSAGDFSYIWNLVSSLSEDQLDARAVEGFSAIGRYLMFHEVPPWVDAELPHHFFTPEFLRGDGHIPALDEVANLGVAVAVCMVFEMYLQSREEEAETLAGDLAGKGTQPDQLIQYINSRVTGNDSNLRDLPVPAAFRQLFRDWAGRRVNFVASMTER